MIALFLSRIKWEYIKSDARGLNPAFEMYEAWPMIGQHIYVRRILEENYTNTWEWGWDFPYWDDNGVKECESAEAGKKLAAEFWLKRNSERLTLIWPFTKKRHASKKENT